MAVTVQLPEGARHSERLRGKRIKMEGPLVQLGDTG